MGKYLKLFDTHTEYLAFTQTSDFIKPNVSHCITENHVHYNPWSWADDYLTFVAKGSGTFTFTPKNSNVISYSTDGGETWTQGNSVAVNSGGKVMWKGTMTPSTSYPQGIGTFSATVGFDVQGNAMSLLYGDNYKGQTSLTEKNCAFYNLFNGNTKVVNTKNLSLPAMTLTNFCYLSMFDGCTSLTTAPQLPAMILADKCYLNMFKGCTNLTTAPQLPATTLAESCYSYMFQGCSSLITAPELPATTLAENCYNYMFSSCTNLTTAPELPATTLVSNCYNYMFNACTSLTKAPELPATTLANYCYGNMFRGCTSLTTAPELPATILVNNCYGYMFYGCSKLNYIKAMFTTTPSTTYTSNWVNGVAASGTFVKNSAAEWDVSGIHGIPEGWTIETASA